MTELSPDMERHSEIKLGLREAGSSLSQIASELGLKNSTITVVSHTFDYLVTTVDGTKIAVAVKFAQKARESTIQEDLSQIAAQVPSELADQVTLFTDEHFEPWQAWNAHHLHECQKTVDYDADQKLSSVLTALKGAISPAIRAGPAKQKKPHDLPAFLIFAACWNNQSLRQMSRSSLSVIT